jgi:hypothetical protein
MAKRKLKKPLPTEPIAFSPTVDGDDDGLMDDLLAHLDSRSSDAQSAHNEGHIPQHADQTGKQDAKSRFKARQVRHALCRSQTPLTYYLAGPEGCGSCPDLFTRGSSYAGEAGKGGKG